MTAPILTGAEFVLDVQESSRPIWGSGEDVLWSEGEPMYLTGPLGTGKSTLQQQLLAARLGLRREVLGLPVEDDGRPVLLVAADRPAQIKRSMRRMLGEQHRSVLGERLRVHKGTPPFDIVKHPELLAEFVGDAGTLLLDSLKDVASPLTSDEVGAAVNRSLQLVIEAGCQVCILHHHRKATSENRRPSKLADVYGSVWLTAGAGSVVTLWGEAGDPVVELLHLKAPAEEVGPLEVEHDHRHGESHRRDRLDVWALLVRAGEDGIEAHGTAETIYGKPTKANVEKVRRRLERLVADGYARRIGEGRTGGPTRYVFVPENARVTLRDPNVTPSRAGHDGHDIAPDLALDLGHAEGHGGHAPGEGHEHPIEGVFRDPCAATRDEGDEGAGATAPPSAYDPRGEWA